MKVKMTMNLLEPKAEKYNKGNFVILDEHYKNIDEIKFKKGFISSITIEEKVKRYIKERKILTINSKYSDGTYEIFDKTGNFYICDQMIDNCISPIENFINSSIKVENIKTEGIKTDNLIPSPYKKKVYLASPFFNDEQLVDMVKVLGTLRNKNLDVFSPYENQHKDLEFGSKEWRDKTFNSDVDHIKWCDFIVAIVDGNYMDSGTAWEIGYAHAINKPVIVVNLNQKPINLMISDSLHAYIDSIESLEKYDFNDLKKIEYKKYVW